MRWLIMSCLIRIYTVCCLFLIYNCHTADSKVCVHMQRRKSIFQKLRVKRVWKKSHLQSVCLLKQAQNFNWQLTDSVAAVEYIKSKHALIKLQGFAGRSGLLIMESTCLASTCFLFMAWCWHDKKYFYFSCHIRNSSYGEGKLSKLFCFPSEKWSTLKGKNLLLLGPNSFLLEKTPFQKGIDVQKANRKS